MTSFDSMIHNSWINIKMHWLLRSRCDHFIWLASTSAIAWLFYSQREIFWVIRREHINTIRARHISRFMQNFLHIIPCLFLSKNTTSVLCSYLYVQTPRYIGCFFLNPEGVRTRQVYLYTHSIPTWTLLPFKNKLCWINSSFYFLFHVYMWHFWATQSITWNWNISYQIN